MKAGKLSTSVIVILLILVVDQVVKIYIKTHYPVGEVTRLFGMDWARIHFIENSGMAWGWKFGNEAGKVALTLFRLAAVIFGSFLLVKFAKEKYTRGFMICVALIYAGALGNLIDSMFYGMLFDKGLHFDPAFGDYIGYEGIAKFGGHGYASFLHGSVVDMLYFPMVKTHYPSWFPGVGGEPFEFFAPIFNIADAAISTGVIALLVFQKRFYKKVEEPAAITKTEIREEQVS
ncbi:lipoprotein signal peptidase [Niabella soli]|uniref:Lipoprotein signal peptidase n=1 Tax=Niabella soli DSM 19437 TaxID=929713 RepID=W0EZY8_9BACT|nr:lipoprotein signal peptidase [Niabella soli]AHF16370.1 peptidase A8 [Niabella soli DSM 19437]